MDLKNIKRGAPFVASGLFPNPAEVIAIRVDPFQKSGSTVLLGKLRLLTKTGKLVKALDLDTARISRTIRATAADDDLFVLEHVENVGPNAMIIFDRPEKRTSWKRVHAIEVSGYAAGVSDSLNVFFDTGHGFTRDEMLTATY